MAAPPVEAGRTRLLRRQLRNALRLALTREHPGPAADLFVLSAGRDGSTLLTSYLNAVPGIHLAGEVWNADTRPGLPFRGVPRALALAHLRHSVRALPGPVRGAKLVFYQLTRRGVGPEHLRASFPEARFLLIYRAHVAAQYVSLLIAARTRQWQLRDPKERREARVEIDRARALRYYASVRADYDAVLGDPWLGPRARVVRYEDLVRDAQGLFEGEILPWLGLPPAPVASGLVRQNPRPLREKVANYDAVRDVLEGPAAWQEYASQGGAPEREPG